MLSCCSLFAFFLMKKIRQKTSLKMADWHPSVGDGKTFTSSDFRSGFPSGMPHDHPHRHMFDCELASAAAAYMRGPSMPDRDVQATRQLMSTGNNCYYYGTETANTRDRIAANAVLRSAYSGERVVLPPDQAAHVRDGALWLHANRGDLRPGFVNSAASLYRNVYDEEGHKVVDGRMFRSQRPK